MPINPKCLVEILRIMGSARELRVQVIDPAGRVRANALINRYGAVRVLPQGPIFDHPSALRDHFIGPNRPTYSYIYYRGQSLAKLGVRPQAIGPA